MNLVKAGGTIGGLTLVSRILGFVREMIFARIMGASAAADIFYWAFQLPNLLRRLFGEGAFSQGFVPLFARYCEKGDDLSEAKRFAEEVQAVFLPVLIIVTAIFVIAMPAVVILVVSDNWTDDPARYSFAVELGRIVFPYLIFISMVSLFSGILNSLSRFTAAAFAPALLNVALVIALLLFPEGGVTTARAMTWGVLAGGVLQLALLVIATKRAGLTLKLRPPKMTPRVKELLIIILPATLGAGGYYISQVFYTYFATVLPTGSMVYLQQADRLNQLPLALVGAAISTAILPAISRHIEKAELKQAANVQGRATELAMLLTIPAAIGLSVAAIPIMTVLFEGGEFTAQDAANAGEVLAILVAGLPAYVMIKVLAPGFYARKNVRTPVIVALVTLFMGVVANFMFIDELGIIVLPISTAVGAWLNAIALYVILAAKGHFHFERWLVWRLVKQLFAAAAMAAVIILLQGRLEGYFDASAGKRVVGTLALVGAGGIVYLTLAWFTGAMDKEDILILLRKKKVDNAG
ncbi:murein biosynthesis integral membrane protein MurJ [Sphingomicrobium lutaoense]|uniref:Probable lipid II flippase MurJ n=1 Tax=Sphingomicrobium lutaoense TaxID=515949 RepID=A0A839YY18_9SPHN|nr:murein biosynthesis integral membrane protein MurJ [Sphingomicrobium lutaoense]MBB3763916.1 putative peptidoglycan lipid II flippase [Sphingomicrobium lutaoense]